MAEPKVNIWDNENALPDATKPMPMGMGAVLVVLLLAYLFLIRK